MSSVNDLSLKRPFSDADDEFSYDEEEISEPRSKVMKTSPALVSHSEAALVSHSLAAPVSHTPVEKTSAGLVSYGVGDDDDELEESVQNVDDPASDHETSSEKSVDDISAAKEPSGTGNNSPGIGTLASPLQSISEDGVQLPPMPTGKCSNKLQDKVAKLYEKMMKTGVDMNQIIERRKDFRNPSIYEKFIQLLVDDEMGTNYEPRQYNPAIWSAESNYLALSERLEKDEIERKKKSNESMVQRLSGTKKSGHEPVTAASSGVNKRQSKWDSQGGAAGNGGSLKIPAVGHILRKS